METEQQTEIRRNRDAVATATSRANETAQQTEIRRNRVAIATVTARANATAEQNEERNRMNAQNMTAVRRSKKTHVALKDAMKTQQILGGTFVVYS